ncbi:MAG: hypothetical protein V4773_25215 [Verrucomicrobiota bacterium]
MSFRLRSLSIPRLSAGALLACAVALGHLSAATGGSIRVEIKDPKGAPVPDAVASLIPLDTPARTTPPTTPIVIVQDKEEFQTYVTAVVVGTQVSFPNRDKVDHHVYSFSKPKNFDIPLYRGEARELITFEQPGIVKIGCNIHDWMSAYIVVLATPFFAKSPNDGIAPISGLPSGRYRLEVWHPRVAKSVDREVTVDTGNPATQVISVTLGVDRRIRRAPETDAGGYR